MLGFLITKWKTLTFQEKCYLWRLYDLYHLADVDIVVEELTRRKDPSQEYFITIDNDDPDFLRWLLSMKVPYPKTDQHEDFDNLIFGAKDRCLLALIEDISVEELEKSCLYDIDLDRLCQLLITSDKALRNTLEIRLLSEISGLIDLELECQLLDRIIAIQEYIPIYFFGDSIRISVHDLPEDTRHKQYIKKFSITSTTSSSPMLFTTLR